jgi:pimeloyl-ACP methyl ester carboxylesterase
VIALHTGAGSPEQWRPLAKRLRLRYRVLAPDLHAYAAGRASGAHQPLSLDAEAARIEPLLDAFPGPVYLVGHDYGAAVALKLAHRRRERIRGLVLYEPTPFGLLLADPGSRVGALDIAVLGRVLWRYLEAGDWFRAARRYVDHRLGADAWQGLSTQERAAIARRMPELCAQVGAQVADPTPLAEYARVDVPVWLLTGARTNPATERMVQLLAGTLPRAEWRRIDGADRMGPISRPEALDREIEGFLAQRQASRRRDPEPTAAFGRLVFRSLRDARERAEVVSL